MRSALRDDVHHLVGAQPEAERRRAEEFREKHGVQVLRTPPDILVAYLKAWDDMASEEAATNPFFKKVLGLAARLCVDRRAGQALHAAAVFVRRQLLLAH